jgi:hypothetical protein
LQKEAKQRKKDNFKIQAANIFRAKNNKINLKEADPFSDHARLYKAWISERVQKKPKTPLSTERWGPKIIGPPKLTYLNIV